MKYLMLITALAHALCGATDCLMTFTPNGRFGFAQMNDAEEMRRVFEGKSLAQLIWAMLLGVAALTVCAFGYLGLADWVKPASSGLGWTMYIGALVFLIPGAAHHVFCGTVEWFYVKLGRTKEALDTITEFFKKTSATMIIAYLGALLFSVALFIAVVTGRTTLPAWACVFNPILLTIVMFLLKVPASANVAGFISFMGLFFMM